MRTLRRGDTGSDVRTLQTALTRAGYDPGPINGIFGAQTEQAVKQFQRGAGPARGRYRRPQDLGFPHAFCL